ncbi:MAG: glycosyltransferase family protein [Candidatus Sulfotelmatobacter sp.]
MSESRASDVPNASEQVRIAAGWSQLHGAGIAGAPFPDPPGTLPLEISEDHGFDTEHSPLLSLVTAAPLLACPRRMLDSNSSPYWRWLPRIPFLACGVFLGASLWYVARRLCGNAGGFLALSLYCFSPSMIQASAVWHTEPEILAAWGAFGAIFTAIAVAHTLYAPREVVLWNWRRILLLGVSLAIAVGSQFSMIIVVPLALGFLLYLAPIRRGSAFIIWAAACAIALAILFAAYFFHAHAFSESMRHASFWGATWRSFAVPGVYREVGLQTLRACPALAVLLPVAITTYVLWPRTRYFGNTAPGAVALLFIGLGMAHPHVAGAGFLLASVPFLLIFVSGILADLMETPLRLLVTACVWGLVGAYILWSVLALAQIPHG